MADRPTFNQMLRELVSDNLLMDMYKDAMVYGTGMMRVETPAPFGVNFSEVSEDDPIQTESVLITANASNFNIDDRIVLDGVSGPSTEAVVVDASIGSLTVDMLRDAARQIAESSGIPDRVFMNPRSFALAQQNFPSFNGPFPDDPLEVEKMMLHKQGISGDKIREYYQPFDGKQHTKDGLFYCCEECSVKWG